MRRIAVWLAVGLLATPALAQFFDESRLGAPQRLADEWPESSESGMVICFQRTHYVAGSICGVPESTDVYVADLAASCGKNVIHRITRDGISLDPSISADGSLVAWRTFDSSATSNANHIFIANSDGTDVQDLLQLDGTVSSLELSPYGDYIAFRVVGRTSTSGAELVRVTVASPSLDVADSSSSSTGITLNRDACITTNGVIAYTKLNGSTHDVYLDDVSSSPALVISTSSYEERLASITNSGKVLAFRRSVSGVENVIEYYATLPSPTPSEHAATANTSSSVHIESVMAFRLELDTPTGYVIFESNGNFTSENSDGSSEVFRHTVASSTIRQLTAFDGSIFTNGRSLAGSALADDGGGIAYATAPATTAGIACDPDDLNMREIRIAGPAADAAVASQSNELLPPFSMITSGTGLGCVNVSTDVEECTVRILNASDKSRHYALNATWNCSSGYPTEKHDTPGAFTLAPDEQADVTFTFENWYPGAPHGTFHVRAMIPDVRMPDTANATLSF